VWELTRFTCALDTIPTPHPHSDRAYFPPLGFFLPRRSLPLRALGFLLPKPTTTSAPTTLRAAMRSAELQSANLQRGWMHGWMEQGSGRDSGVWFTLPIDITVAAGMQW
jgi:hypothetical protein